MEEVLIRGDFRGAPPGHEQERYLPYFYMGPPSAFLTASNTGRANQLFSMARRDLKAPWKGEKFPQTFGPVVIFATYPKAARGLRSPDWLARYSHWEAALRTTRGLRLPSIAGLVPDLELRMGVPEGDPATFCSNLLNDALAMADPLEALFDSPPASAIPIKTELVEVSPQQSEMRRSLTYTCPACGRSEGAQPYNPKFGWLTNVCTVRCKREMYAGRVAT